MKFASDVYIEAVKTLEVSHEDWSTADANQLSEILSASPIAKALAIILIEAGTMLDQFRTIDLNDPKGLSEATKLQGVVEGFEMAVSRLAELADTAETKNADSRV